MNLMQFARNERFLMLALDHRGSFKKAINPDDPDSVTPEQAIEIKAKIIGSLADQFSGVLIDPTFGLPAYKQVFADATQPKPYLLPTEKTGYQDSGQGRQTDIEYAGAQLIEMGAGGAKLLLYFNPDAPTAMQQIEVGKQVLADAHANDLPLFLEIVAYQLEGQDVPQSELIVRSVEMYMQNDLKPDVFKLAYPGDDNACQQVNDLVQDIPWILLTAGKSFETFTEQLTIAANHGATGFLAGRALWQEIFDLQGEDLDTFLNQTLPGRFETVSNILLA